MTLRLKAGSQLRMVVDLAVENDPDILIFIRQRLMTTLDVNNAEASHGQADVLFHEKPFIIRPAMHDAAVHAGEDVPFDVPVTIRKENAADSTHKLDLLRTSGHRVRRQLSNLF